MGERTYSLNYENGYTKELAEQHLGVKPQPDNQFCWMPARADGS
jgi:hypothetical protein